MKISDMQDMMEHYGDCTDYTVNGECSNCGECCGAILPVTGKELKAIRRYVKKHHIKPVRHGMMGMTNQAIDLTCPFRDNTARKCLIYEVRPWICREYRCDKYCRHETFTVRPAGVGIVNMRKEFDVI